MADAPLLVSLPRTDELSEVLERRLRGVAFEFVDRSSPGPWPQARAMLVGTLQRELPDWRAERAPRLEFVQRVYTGLDDFPFDRFPTAVRVAGNVGAFAPFVAEHAVMLVLALAHDALGNHERVRSGHLRPAVPNRYLLGRTVLLLGFGAIARETAERLRPFGARIEGLSRTGAPDPGSERMYAESELLRALGTADVVVDCRPLTARTRGTLDARALAAMRPNAIYVNVGRAGTVDEEALFHHLGSAPEFRAGLDVFWEEEFARGELPLRFPFSSRPNFLGSPHIAGVGPEVRQRTLEMAVENLGRFFAGTPPRHVADRAEYVRPPP